MNIREYLKRYAFSAAGSANLIIAAAAGLAAGLATTTAVGVAAGIGAYALVFALALLTGIGPRQAVAERDRLLSSDARERLDGLRKTVTRLAALRMPDPALKSLIDLAGLKAGSYLTACARSGSRDPRAEDAINECLELADLYLKELDDDATERRFGQADDDAFADAAGRVAGELKGRIALVEKAILDLDGGLGSEDRLSIKEQL